MNAAIQIKGIRDGLLVTLGEGTWDEIQAALFEQIDQQADFMKGARLAIDVGDRTLKAVEMSRLRSDIQDRQLSLWAVISLSPVTIQTAQTLGLATRITQPRPELTSARLETNLQGGEQAVLFRRTLRSGFSIHHPGHVVVIGDINPGAEVIAGGDIIVWGRARGALHAGADGNEEAVVCALDLSPAQLRIASVSVGYSSAVGYNGGIASDAADGQKGSNRSKIALLSQKRGKLQPELASLRHGQVALEPWDPKKTR
jgi:septum site-determining protein MinC